MKSKLKKAFTLATLPLAVLSLGALAAKQDPSQKIQPGNASHEALNALAASDHHRSV